MIHSTRSLAALALLLAAGCVSASPGAAPQAPAAIVSTVALLPDSAIAAILRQRVEADKTPGIVAGVLDASGPRFITSGTGGPTGPRDLDANTLFEIGSITKVITSVILADMVTRGELRLDDPVATLLPAGTRVPATGDRQITLVDLATHHSGLPRLPNNLSPRDAANPYVDYTTDKLYAFLAAHELRRPVGVQFEYSNLGVGLLATALAVRGGTDYETLARNRVLAPLGMTDTRIALGAVERARLASGRNAGGQVVPPWDLASLQGAGALRSSASDMLRFLAANIAAHVDSSRSRPLGAALRLTHEPRRSLGPGADIGLGWIRNTTASGANIYAHDGGTGGHVAYAAFDPARRVAVIVLSASTAPISDIGRHLLDSSHPLTRERVEVTLPAAALEGLIGEYQLRPDVRVTITRDGTQLYLQLTGQPRFPAFAESQSSFFLRVVDAQITFSRGADGRATSLTLHQGGASIPGQRVK